MLTAVSLEMSAFPPAGSEVVTAASAEAKEQSPGLFLAGGSLAHGIARRTP